MGARGQNAAAGPVTVQNLVRLPVYFARGLRYHAAGRLYTPKPLVVGYRVTRRCNSRCVMCSDWKTGAGRGELTLAQIRDVFSSPVFDSAEKFILTGGEPTLREDLAEIADAVLQVCPNIREMVLLSNGLDTSLVLEQVRALLALAARRKLRRLAVSVSVDGCDGVHEAIRRVPHAFERVAETARRLKALQNETSFYFHGVCVVQPLNLRGLVDVARFGAELRLPITFVPVWLSDSFAHDPSAGAALRFTGEQLAELKTVFREEIEPGLMPSNVPLWREYFKVVNGHRRSLPCILRRHYAGMDGDGTLYMCNADSALEYGSVLDTPPDRLWYSEESRELRDRAERDFCPACTVCCDLAFTFSQEFFSYALFLAREKGRKLLSMTNGRNRSG